MGSRAYLWGAGDWLEESQVGQGFISSWSFSESFGDRLLKDVLQSDMKWLTWPEPRPLDSLFLGSSGRCHLGAAQRVLKRKERRENSKRPVNDLTVYWKGKGGFIDLEIIGWNSVRGKKKKSDFWLCDTMLRYSAGNRRYKRVEEYTFNKYKKNTAGSHKITTYTWWTSRKKTTGHSKLIQEAFLWSCNSQYLLFPVVFQSCAKQKQPITK